MALPEEIKEREQHKNNKQSKSKASKKSKTKKSKKKETFCGRIFKKIIGTDIPVKKALNAVLIGYICGIIITVLWYNYVTKVELNILQWIYMIIIGFIIILLSYSMEVRCTLAVSIPILCSSRGRSIIMAGAFFLVATGPTVNIFRNINVMVSSLTCGQMQLKQALSDMLDTLKKPLVTIKEAIRNAINDLRLVLNKVQLVLLKIQNLIMIILASIKNAFSWLENIVKMCNTEFGTPFDRCMNISRMAMEDCIEKLGPIKGLCHLTKIFSMLCYAAKVVDVICVLVDIFHDAIIATVLRKLQMFIAEIKRLFDVSISFDHDFYFQTTSSKQLSKVKEDIMADIHRKMKSFLIIFGWLDMITFGLFIWIIIKAIYFRLKYIHNLRYQNYYITAEFDEIDEKRKKMKMETVLPLTFVEKLKYTRISQCRLTKNEWKGIAQSSMFLIISSTQLFCICFCDYSLYWILAMIAFYGYKELGFEVPPYITVEVKGDGFVSEIFRGIVHAFEPITQNYTVDSRTCLPHPTIPNYANYYLIAMVASLAWIFLFFQPYGLRLRHTVMRLYYPDIAKQRAVWLYDKILLRRTSFFKLARRKARLLFSKDTKADNFTCMEWLRVRTEGFFLCRMLLGEKSKEKCILCGIPLQRENRVKCQTPGCMALYCQNCFKESYNVCCICNTPIEYGDFSDVSEVHDSSDDPDVVHVDETEAYCVR